MEVLAIQGEQFKQDVRYGIDRKTVGIGSFGVCFKVRVTTNRDPFTFCIKTTGYSQGINEILVLKLANKRKIRQIVGFLVGKLGSRKAFICMEYMPGGTLGRYVDTRMVAGKGPVPKETCFDFGKDILLALQFLHDELRIVHRDVHGGNVLLDKYYTHVKLADFGSARAIQKPREWSDDIWKTGCLLLFMLNGKISPLICVEGSEYERQSAVKPGRHFPSQAPEFVSSVFGVGREGLLSAKQLLGTCVLKEK